MSDNDDFFGLVMPFVVVTSKGGPHEDSPFTAGYECGYLDRLLETRDIEIIDRYIHTSIVPQLDLVAMRHKYTMKWEVWVDSPDWTKVVLTRNKET